MCLSVRLCLSLAFKRSKTGCSDFVIYLAQVPTYPRGSRRCPPPRPPLLLWACGSSRCLLCYFHPGVQPHAPVTELTPARGVGQGTPRLWGWLRYSPPSCSASGFLPNENFVQLPLLLEGGSRTWLSALPAS